MKFTVEVEEFWIEEDELAASLARQIKDEIVNQMKKTVDAKIDEQITLRVVKVIDEHIKATITAKLDELIETGVIMKDGKAIAIKDHVSQLFTNNTSWNSPTEKIKALADGFGKELKARYDALFANRIVAKLNEQGMLKDEVVKLLITKS
jgi:hypothetical protein